MNKFVKLLVVAMLAIPSVALAQDCEKMAVMAQKKATGSDSTSVVYSHSQRRQNRGIANIRTEFVPKGQWVFGGSVSYSTHTNNNYNFLIIEDIQSNGYQFKVTPLVGYAYSKNSLIGVRFGYSRGLTELDNASLSITSLDNSFFYSLKHAYNVEALWRKYIPLGRDNKRFALFAEVGLVARSQSSSRDLSRASAACMNRALMWLSE